MKELMEMRDKRVQSWNAAKAFLESHRGEDGTLSAEDDAIFNKMMDDVDKLGREIARMEKMEAMDVEMSKATSKPLTSAPRSRREWLREELLERHALQVCVPRGAECPAGGY